MLIDMLGRAVVIIPTSLLLAVSLPSLLNRPLNERLLSRWTETSVIAGLASSVLILLLMLVSGERRVPIEFGNWVVLPDEHFHFHLSFEFDRLSVPFVILTYVLVGTTGAFANRYLHREPGYNRFFILYAVFLLGMVIASLACTIETLFLGWELVGISSALLVAFFHERPLPVRNGQRIWSIYRVSDAAFLVAAVALHHLRGAGEFSELLGEGAWPEGAASLTPREALFVGLFLVIAAIGKSALVPLSGWLPRAMEGPTPSSAIFYGALSVHLGVYLLLRVSPILELSPTLCGIVVCVGLATAFLGACGASVQADVKSALAFASMTQVGIITVEIGLGFRYLALIHIIGHASLRTLQLLRAPSLLQDYTLLENAIGRHLRGEPATWVRRLPHALQLGLYRWAIERGGLDACIDAWLVHPFLAIFRFFDKLERRWTNWLAGVDSRESDRIRLDGLKGEEPQ